MEETKKKAKTMPIQVNIALKLIILSLIVGVADQIRGGAYVVAVVAGTIGLAIYILIYCGYNWARLVWIALSGYAFIMNMFVGGSGDKLIFVVQQILIALPVLLPLGRAQDEWFRERRAARLNRATDGAKAAPSP